MNDSDKSVLKRYHQQLADDIIVDEEFLGGLYTEGIFEKGMNAIIRSQPTPTEKIQKLLELLPKRGPTALTKFIKVIETTYPWLATVLSSARETEDHQNKGPRNSDSSNKRLPSTSSPETLLIDKDIKHIVAAFVHRQFGQSKRISEKDKKTVERFLSHQVQGERNRYQRLLCSASETPDHSRNETPDDVFTRPEVGDKLYSLHIKLEPYVIQETSELDPPVDPTGRDDDGHPNYRNPQRRQSNRQDRQVPKLYPEDMDFDLIHKEIDIVLSQIDILSGKINDSLRYFEASDCIHYPLATLVGRVINKCRALEEESMQDRHQIKLLLNERDMQSDAIARMETERTEHRKQIQAAFMDMASLRQDKSEMRSKVKDLEQALNTSKQQHQSERKTTFQYGVVSKSIKTTPRGGAMSNSVVGGLLATTSQGTAGTSTIGQSVKSNQRPGNNYLNYARRGPTPNRTNMSFAARKKQMAKSDTNLSSTAKF